MKRIPFFCYIIIPVMIIAAIVAIKNNMETVVTVEVEATNYVVAEAETEAAVEATTVAEETVESYVSPINFEELKAVNSDVVACVGICDEDVMPVLYDGTDRYLHEDINGNRSAHGSIYMSANLNPDDDLRIMYGHHMKDGSMFACVDDLAHDDEMFSNASMKMYYENEEVNLKPFAAIIGSADGSLESIATADDLVSFAANKIVAEGNVSEWVGPLYVTVTCNYEGTDYRTYVFWAEV